MKKGIINQLKTIGEMIIFNIISAVLFAMAYSNMTKLQENPLTGGPLPSHGYKLNLYLYIISMSILLILYAIYCFTFFKKRFEVACKIKWGFIVLFIVNIILFLIMELIIWSLSRIFTTGLFSVIVNESDAFLYIIAIVFVLLPIIMMIYSLIKNEKDKC